MRIQKNTVLEFKILGLIMEKTLQNSDVLIQMHRSEQNLTLCGIILFIILFYTDKTEIGTRQNNNGFVLELSSFLIEAVFKYHNDTKNNNNTEMIIIISQ